MSKSSFTFFVSLSLLFILAALGFGQTRTGKLGVGVDGSMQYALGGGTVVKPSPGIGYGVNLSFSAMEYLGIRAKFCVNQIGWTSVPYPSTSPNYSSSYKTPKSQLTDIMSLNMYLSADLMPNSNFNIFLLGGGGFALLDPKDNDGKYISRSSSDLHYIVGTGADYFLNEFWSVTLMAEYVMTNSPYYAGSTLVGNKPNYGSDTFLRGSLQIRYYFFDQAFITKILDAQRERSKRSK